MEPNADGLDPEPELVVEVAYIQAFKRLTRRVSALAVAVVVGMGTGFWAAWYVSEARVAGHNDTQAQIRTLVCLVIDSAPPDHGLADKLRHDYRCGPYIPSKAKVKN